MHVSTQVAKVLLALCGARASQRKKFMDDINSDHNTKTGIYVTRGVHHKSINASFAHGGTRRIDKYSLRILIINVLDFF
jgi:hypothetical protein